MAERPAFSCYFHTSEFDDLMTWFNKAEKAEKDGNIWTMEAYSNEAFRALDNITTKLLFIRVNGFVQQREFRKAYAAAEAIVKTAERKKGAAQLFYILMKEK